MTATNFDNHNVVKVAFEAIFPMILVKINLIFKIVMKTLCLFCSHFHLVDATIYVGGLDEKVSETLLWELFLQAGPVGKLKCFHSTYMYALHNLVSCTCCEQISWIGC